VSLEFFGFALFVALICRGDQRDFSLIY